MLAKPDADLQSTASVIGSKALMPCNGVGLPLEWVASYEAAVGGRQASVEEVLSAEAEAVPASKAELEEDRFMWRLCKAKGKDSSATGNKIIAWLNGLFPEDVRNRRRPQYSRVLIPALLAGAKHAGGTAKRELR